MANAATKDKNPKVVTIYGRLSFPNFTMAQAVERNKRSDFPKKDADITPDFNMLVEQAQLDKLVAHVKDEFLPYCIAQQAAGEKRDALEKKNVDKLLKLIDSAEWENQPPYIPIKEIKSKTQELAPEAVASIKVVGNKGVDIDLRAVVRNEEELLVPDPEQLTFPTLRPIGQTVHKMYGGCYVAATLNLYAYMSGALPGFSASAGVCVFREDGERFGGGVSIDEDEIFMD